MTASVEKEGSQANSGRWMQWKYAAAEGPGDAMLHGRRVLVRVMSKLKELYAKDGGTFPEPILAANTDFVDGKGRYDPERVAKYINGYFLKRRDHQRRGIQEGRMRARLRRCCRPTARPRAATGSVPAASPALAKTS